MKRRSFRATPTGIYCKFCSHETPGISPICGHCGVDHHEVGGTLRHLRRCYWAALVGIVAALTNATLAAHSLSHAWNGERVGISLIMAAVSILAAAWAGQTAGECWNLWRKGRKLWDALA